MCRVKVCSLDRANTFMYNDNSKSAMIIDAFLVSYSSNTLDATIEQINFSSSRSIIFEEECQLLI
jgi:hypothetical protein